VHRFCFALDFSFVGTAFCHFVRISVHCSGARKSLVMMDHGCETLMFVVHTFLNFFSWLGT
jgi:hypothetical protein